VDAGEDGHIIDGGTVGVRVFVRVWAGMVMVMSGGNFWLWPETRVASVFKGKGKYMRYKNRRGTF
jgi:hypothetical protein